MQLKNQKSSIETYKELSSIDNDGFLIDVRSKSEWRDTGVADFSILPDKLVLCQWRMSPSMEVNVKFFSELSEKIDFQQAETLYFICAAGIRSQEAADYTRKKLKDSHSSIECINVFDGFNGNSNKFFGFGKVNGWKAAGLPCRQFEEPTLEN